MKDNAKVFLLVDSGEYMEITYQEFALRREQNPDTYGMKWFIRINGMLLEVKRDDYIAHYMEARRHKYAKEEADLHDEISYDALDTNEMNGEGTIIDPDVNVEGEVELSILKENLRKALNSLTQAEVTLLYALYADNKTERQVSAETGLPQKTINDRKQVILRKIKKIMKI